jgi:hypothetical protein
VAGEEQERRVDQYLVAGEDALLLGLREPEMKSSAGLARSSTFGERTRSSPRSPASGGACVGSPRLM